MTPTAIASTAAPISTAASTKTVPRSRSSCRRTRAQGAEGRRHAVAVAAGAARSMNCAATPLRSASSNPRSGPSTIKAVASASARMQSSATTADGAEPVRRSARRSPGRSRARSAARPGRSSCGSRRRSPSRRARQGDGAARALRRRIGLLDADAATARRRRSRRGCAPRRRLRSCSARSPRRVECDCSDGIHCRSPWRCPRGRPAGPGINFRAVLWPGSSSSARQSTTPRRTATCSAAGTRRRLLTPKPHASTAGDTVTSNAPSDQRLTSRADASTANSSDDSGTGTPATARLKALSSDSGR